MWCSIYVIWHQSVNFHSVLFIIFFRALITMTVSSVWHGVYVGYYLCLMSAPMYLPVEDVYVKIRRETTGLVCVTVPYLLNK
jgi:Predicted membrane protein